MRLVAMPGGGYFVRRGVSYNNTRYQRRARSSGSSSSHVQHYYTRSLLEPPRRSSHKAWQRCQSAPMEPHSRPASPPAPRPAHRPPSPPAGHDNRGYTPDDADPNHNDSFTSTQANGHSKEPNGDTKLEAVNLELINLKPKNGKPKKDVEVDMNSTNPYDEYFVPVNEHKKYMRGEKLYVTADKRSEKGGCKRTLCWTVFGLAVAVALVVVIVVLAATGTIFNNSPTTVEQYNASSISSARALGGIGSTDHDHSSHDDSDHDHSDHDHSDHDHSGIEGHDHNAETTPKTEHGPEVQSDQRQETSEESDAGFYVPRTLEGELKVDNEVFTAVMSDPESAEYQQFASDFAEALKKSLFDRNTLENSDNDITVEVVQLREGSVIVTYRVHWKPKVNANSSYNTGAISAQYLMMNLNNYLERNDRMINVYHIAEEKIDARPVLDACQANNNLCEYKCEFDESTLEFACICPPGQIVVGKKSKKCVSIFAPGPANDQERSFSSKDSPNSFDWQEYSRVPTETTTASDVVLNHSHIFGSANKQEPKAKPEPTPEPTSEPEPASKPEPESTSEPDASLETQPRAEPEPTSKSTLADEPNSAPEPKSEPAAEPEPSSETAAAPEPASESIAEPEPAPQPEPTTEPTPEPEANSKLAAVPEPSSDPTAEPEPEPSSANFAESEPSPVPTAVPSAEPEPSSASYVVPEPTAEPSAESEPEATSEPEPSSEPNAEPSAEPKPEPTSEPEPSSKPNAEPSAEPEPEPTTEPEPSSKSNAEPSAEPKPEPTSEPETSSKPNAEPSAEPKPEPTSEPEPSSKPNAEPFAEPKLEPTSKPEPSSEPNSEPSAEPEPKPEPTSEPELSSVLVPKKDSNSATVTEIERSFEENSETTQATGNSTENEEGAFNLETITELEAVPASKGDKEHEPNTAIETAINKNHETRPQTIIFDPAIIFDDLKSNEDTDQTKTTTKQSENKPSIKYTPDFTSNTMDHAANESEITALTNAPGLSGDITFDQIANFPKHSSIENILPTNPSPKESNLDLLIGQMISSGNQNETSTTSKTPNSGENDTIESTQSEEKSAITSRADEARFLKLNDTFLTTTSKAEEITEYSLASQLEQEMQHGADNSFETVNSNIKETTTDSDLSVEGLDVTFDNIQMMYNQSTSQIYSKKTITDKDNDEMSQATTTDKPESDWLTELLSTEEVNSGEDGNFGVLANHETTETTPSKVEYFIKGQKDDFEPDYLTNIEENNKKSYADENPLYGMAHDYESPDPRWKRVGESKTHNDGVFTTDLDMETTTVSDYIYKTADTKQTDNLESIMVHIAESISDSQTKQSNNSESISNESSNNMENEFGVKLNDTQNANLHVTIYEIPSQTLNNTFLPQKTLTGAQTSEYDDHETEMNPFLPEVENNKSLVKKLQEGHDLEPANLNETQNDNIEDHHNLAAEARDIKDINSSEKVINSEVTKDSMPAETLLNQQTTEKIENHKSNEDDLTLSKFLSDTDDLLTSHEHSTTDISTTKASEKNTAAIVDQVNLAVVPIETAKVEGKRKKLNKSETSQDLNDISDYQKKSDRRTFNENNLDSVTSNEA